MNKFQACRVAVAAIISLLVIVMLKNIVIYFVMAIDFLSKIDINSWLYFNGPVICAIIPSSGIIMTLLVFEYDKEIDLKLKGTIYYSIIAVGVSTLAILSLITVVVNFWLIDYITIVNGEPALNILVDQYRTSMIITIFTLISVFVYKSSVSKEICKLMWRKANE